MSLLTMSIYIYNHDAERVFFSRSFFLYVTRCEEDEREREKSRRRYFVYSSGTFFRFFLLVLLLDENTFFMYEIELRVILRHICRQ